jgi:hypothetical protein
MIYKYSLFILILSIPYSGCTQSSTKNLIRNWNTALVENLEWQTKQISDTFYLKMLSERIGFISKDKDEGFLRKDLIEKLDAKVFKKEATIIYVTNIHDEYAYLVNDEFLYQYILKKGEWELIKEKKCSTNLSTEIANQLTYIGNCSDEAFELPLNQEISITHFYNKEQVKAIYLIKICRQHIDLLNKLNIY